jgi:hypothetical protein
MYDIYLRLVSVMNGNVRIYQLADEYSLIFYETDLFQS